MKPLPTISIVVPSFNQAQYLPETLQSLVDQNYPNLQVIIQEGQSRDGSVEIAEDFVRRYPEIFQLYVEKDDGQADALNRGFARTTGEIMAFLNSDDTYFPGTLHRVAAEVDPARERYVVMGRSIFTGAGSRYVGIEHPAEYVSHFEHLAIWKRGFNTIPQPSVFWHRAVWQRCGRLDVNEHHALDYDLFCRFSKYYRFHKIDELFSTYRMHDSSKSSQRTEAEVLDLSIGVSRKHWGAWWDPMRWRCTFSHWWHNRHLHERARHHARRAEDAFSERRYATALMEFLRTLTTSPKMARDRLVYGWLAAKGGRLFRQLAVISEGYTERYPDGWIGPVYRRYVEVPENSSQIVITATHSCQPGHRKIATRLFINGALVDSKKVQSSTTFSLGTDAAPYQGTTVMLEIRTDSYFVPSKLSEGQDNRQLSLQLNDISLTSASSLAP
ncbi:glycosyltransferase family 2 protein [Paraburkholderia adhaesiva]|uniref:glycosyltransferase family 2 protein n=1 Tax=Paraburkholderia adhaesiva TaxID=2883244 RepID=UPI001F2BC7FE|nr:glycosyltransferase family 2 protein [Paraburkholderia adhaesiva]